jgi:hypothetical protein
LGGDVNKDWFKKKKKVNKPTVESIEAEEATSWNQIVGDITLRQRTYDVAIIVNNTIISTVYVDPIETLKERTEAAIAAYIQEHEVKQLTTRTIAAIQSELNNHG